MPETGTVVLVVRLPPALVVNTMLAVLRPTMVGWKFGL